MITYNDLYEYLRKERYSEQLQLLPKDFLHDVVGYFEDKKEIVGKGGDLFSDAVLKTKKQFENAISLFKELMLRRRKKLLNLAFVAAETGISKRDFDNMLDFEKDLFDKIVKGMEEAERGVNEFLNGKKTKAITNRMVLFKQDTDEFLGMEGESLGPYKKGDIANLPNEIAKILQDGGKIEVIVD
jgi:DNA replication initiation complex subunit (GINS family)